jgi:NAD+ synthase (glutamine-hydrolysing)
VIDVCGRNIAVMVGDDLSRLNELDSEADFVVSINSRRYGKGLLSRRLETMRNLTYTEGRNIVLINQVGGSGDLVYDGTSGIMNKRGEVELLMKSFEEDFVIFDTMAEHESVDVPYTTYNDRTRMVYQAACLGIRDYFIKSGYQKACVGLSGGIDSSVVACLAVGALGKENVKGLMLPSQFSSEESVEDAKQLADNLGIEFSVLPINEAYTAIMDTLKPVTGGTEFDATEENIQSRIRTVLLMALQNKDGYVLLNSSNKSENAIGWCTLYGDTAGAFSPTGDLYKSEVYDLARYINLKFDDVIPESILKKEPSSELRPNQKDSDILPPYEVIDAILYRMIEVGQHREEIINAGFDSEVVERIHTMVMQNVKKRYQYPPVLRLSTSSFRHECLFPLVNKYGY